MSANSSSPVIEPDGDSLIEVLTADRRCLRFADSLSGNQRHGVRENPRL